MLDASVGLRNSILIANLNRFILVVFSYIARTFQNSCRTSVTIFGGSDTHPSVFLESSSNIAAAMIRQQSSGAEIGPDPARDKFNLGQQGLGDQNNVLGRMPGNFPGPEPPSTPEHYASNATSSFTSAPTPTTTSKLLELIIQHPPWLWQMQMRK